MMTSFFPERGSRGFQLEWNLNLKLSLNLNLNLNLNLKLNLNSIAVPQHRETRMLTLAQKKSSEATGANQALLPPGQARSGEPAFVILVR
jgi:hypothetical protein